VLASEANHQNVKNMQISSKGRTWYGQGKIYSRSKVSRTHSDRSDIFHVPSSMFCNQEVVSRKLCFSNLIQKP
jgi:hypothetical protein